jgi:hypothetical protein
MEAAILQGATRVSLLDVRDRHAQRPNQAGVESSLRSVSEFLDSLSDAAAQNASARVTAQFATGRSSDPRYLAPSRRAVAANTRSGPAKHINAKGM